MTVVDKSKERYPGLSWAKYMEYVGIDKPESIKVSFSNVSVSLGAYKKNPENPELQPSFLGGSWGWSEGGSFSNGFASPQEAIEDYNDFINFSKRKDT